MSGSPTQAILGRRKSFESNFLSGIQLTRRLFTLDKPQRPALGENSIYSFQNNSFVGGMPLSLL